MNRHQRRAQQEAQSTSSALLRLQGQKIPGGCADCDAYQTLASNPASPRVTLVNVWHDDTCPSWRAMNAGGAA